jgi:intracellular multiplication protein IcmK
MSARQLQAIQDNTAPAALPPIPAHTFYFAERKQSPVSLADLKKYIRRQVSVNMLASSHASAPLTVKNETVQGSFANGIGARVIKIGTGYVTSIAFEGADGTPWPVMTATSGNPALFKAAGAYGKKLVKNTPTNVVIISARQFGGSSTISILLKDAPAPLTLVLHTGKKNSDGTVTVRMNRSSPGTPPPTMLPSAPMPVSGSMYSFLEDLPPKAATPLNSNMQGVSAWTEGSSMYIRSRYPLLSPAWSQSARSADGELVYEVPFTPVVLVSFSGAAKYVHFVKIGGNNG